MSDVTLLKDISAKITKGTTPSTVGNEFKTQGITFFKAQSIDDEGRVVKGKLAYIDDETDEKLKRSRIVKDDLLITIAGTIGRVHRVDDKYTPANCNQAVAIVRLNQPIDSKYVYYALRNPKVQGGFLGRVVHAVQANLSLTEIGLTEIYFPEIEFRESIAEVLSSIDDKIDLLNRQNETLEAMAQTLFRQWFIEEADDSWEKGTLNEVLSVKGGATPSTKSPEYWGGDIAWTSPRDITTLNGIHLFHTEKTLTPLGLSKVSSGLLPKGTLLMSSRAPVGALAFSEIDVAVNQGYIAITDDKELDKLFIYCWLKENLDIVHAYSNGSTFMEISKRSFKSIKCLIPPKSKHDNFVALVSPLFEKIRLNEKSVLHLSLTRDTLLPKLMSGEVRVKLD